MTLLSSKALYSHPGAGSSRCQERVGSRCIREVLLHLSGRMKECLGAWRNLGRGSPMTSSDPWITCIRETLYLQREFWKCSRSPVRGYGAGKPSRGGFCSASVNSCVRTRRIKAHGDDVGGKLPVIQGLLHGLCFRLSCRVISAGNAENLVFLLLNEDHRQSVYRRETF